MAAKKRGGIAWGVAMSSILTGPCPYCLDSSKTARKAYWHLWEISIT